MAKQNSPQYSRALKNTSMDADPSLSNPVEVSASEIDIPNHGVEASQMQSNDGSMTTNDTDDKFKKFKELTDFSSTHYADASLEDINTDLSFNLEDTSYKPNQDGSFTISRGSGDQRYDEVSSVIDLFNEGEFSTVLGTLTDDWGWDVKAKSPNGNKVEFYKYGNVEWSKNKDGNTVEKVTITSKNHPLYGKSYNTVSKQGTERKTMKPVLDAQELLSNYGTDGIPDDYARVMGIKSVDGKPVFPKEAISDIRQAINKGYLTHKNEEPLTAKEKNDLLKSLESMYKRFRGRPVRSTTEE